MEVTYCSNLTIRVCDHFLVYGIISVSTEMLFGVKNEIFDRDLQMLHEDIDVAKVYSMCCI